VAYLRTELNGHPFSDVARALDDLCGAAEQAEPDARELLVAIVDLLSGDDELAFSGKLREEAAQHSLLALARLLRRPASPIARRAGHADVDTPVPTRADLEHVAQRIAERVGRWLERHGYTFDPSAHEREPDFAEQSAQTSLRLGPLATVDDQGRVTPLARRPVRNDPPKTKGVAQGFDLHADVCVAAGDRDGRERLCRYILRPSLVLERLSRTQDGRIAYERKYKSEGASHVVTVPPGGGGERWI